MPTEVIVSKAVCFNRQNQLYLGGETGDIFRTIFQYSENGKLSFYSFELENGSEGHQNVHLPLYRSFSHVYV